MAGLDEHKIRNLLADEMSLNYLVEVLLTSYLKTFGPGVMEGVALTLLENGKRIDQLKGIAQTEADAELVSDVTMRMHVQLEDTIRRALYRLGAKLPG